VNAATSLLSSHFGLTPKSFLRIVCDHGVAARYPFLDENVVRYLNSLPIGDKCDLRLPRGLGEKLLLRGVAYTLGLGKVAHEPKRAIQFGTRIARMENRKEKATDKAIRID
jgi:asparagine synthetase B (glutamine-hydrolysing)